MVVCVDGTNAARALEPTAAEWAKTLGHDVDVDVATVIHPLDAARPDSVLDAIAGPMDARGLHAQVRAS